MNAHVLDAQVTGYEDLIPTLALPDPDDRNVLAAAVRCGATGIVTFNLSDFPQEQLTSHNVEAVHPDEFVMRFVDKNVAAVCAACTRQWATLKNPPKTVEEYVAVLDRAGFAQTVAPLHSPRESL